MNLPKIEELETVKDAEIPGILAGLSALQGALAARLMNGKPHSPDKKDKLLSVKEVSEIIGCSKDWLYRRTKTLPFVVRLGNQIRYSENGIERYIQQRKGN